ncbi:putative pyrophosphatase [Salmonella phage 40]|nr:putative pyrophosphatase [Salmonella phage 40]
MKRRTYPGKGLWALPGGFFDAWQDQTQVDTALRELKEETKMIVRYKELKGSIDKVEEFW